MAKKKYYWKALAISGDKFVSRIIRGKYCLVYPVGRWVKSPIGKIFIFRTREDAHCFNGDYSPCQRVCIKRCEAKGVTEPRGDRMNNETPERFRSFWRKVSKNGSLPISHAWPVGTLWTEAIKIIE